VIGANGAGKTTLMRVISGMLPASGGTMTMEGVDLRTTPAHSIVELGIAHVPESRRLFPQLSVEDNLRLGAFIPSARPHLAERLDYVYGLFPRLKERRAQLAGTMSGGEQQVFELVRRIRSEGYTVLIVEQNVSQVLKVADRAYLLEVGRIERSGSAAELAASDDIRKAYMGI
jgi:branched-chain amino acid transport system ATP-binding protein